MGGEDDRKWRQVQREREQHVIPPGDERHVHPANEGRDEERTRERLQSWAAEERPGGRAARALEAMGGVAPPGEPAAGSGPPPNVGEPRGPDEHGHRARGGEPKKHPRSPAASTPEPSRGPHLMRGKSVGEPPTSPEELQQGPPPPSSRGPKEGG